MRERNQKNFARARVSENPPISRQNNPHLLVVLADFAETTLAPVKVELCNANIISQTKNVCFGCDDKLHALINFLVCFFRFQPYLFFFGPHKGENFSVFGDLLFSFLRFRLSLVKEERSCPLGGRWERDQKRRKETKTNFLVLLKNNKRRHKSSTHNEFLSSCDTHA